MKQSTFSRWLPGLALLPDVSTAALAHAQVDAPCAMQRSQADAR